MLRQEINLYRQFETQPTTADLLTWKRYWLMNAAFLILLIIILIASYFENVYSRYQEKKLQISLANYQSEFMKIKKTLPQLFFKNDVNEAVASMKKELAAQQEIISLLSKNTPFSEVLISFSRTIIPNVWLTNISIQKNGNEITIKGDTIGSYVDEYIAKIDQDKYFKDFRIKLNEVKNLDTKDSSSKLNFEITMVKIT